MRIDNLALTDTDYFKDGEYGVDLPKLDVEITRLSINFERYWPKDENFSNAFKNVTVKMPFDLPGIRTFLFQTGCAQDVFTTSLGPGTKCAYVAFAYAHR